MTQIKPGSGHTRPWFQSLPASIRGLDQDLSNNLLISLSFEFDIEWIVMSGASIHITVKQCILGYIFELGVRELHTKVDDRWQCDAILLHPNSHQRKILPFKNMHWNVYYTVYTHRFILLEYKMPSFFSSDFLKLQICFLFGVSMENASKWLQTYLCLVQWFLRYVIYSWIRVSSFHWNNELSVNCEE